MTVLTVLADPVRRRLCEHLRHGEATAGALVALMADEFGISQPATSRHLRLLREAGVVEVRHVATSRHYALNTSGIAEAAEWLTALISRPVPAPALDALATEVARGRREARAADGHAPSHTSDAPPSKETA